MTLFPGEYVTITFVVRKGGDLEEPEDPRTLLTDDEVMWWGSEPGITQYAITQGADLSSWHEDVKETTACRHCGHGIGYSETEGWVAPDAGYDIEGGDGMWRDMCPDRDDEPNPPHEPEEQEQKTCLYCGQQVKHGDRGLLVDLRTEDWWCRANPSNGGDAAPHEEA